MPKEKIQVEACAAAQYYSPGKRINLIQSELILAEEPSTNYVLSRTTVLSTMGPISFYIFLTVTMLAVFIPLNPRMPSTGVDASWQFAMNQAVSRNLSFGKEVMFTYGPYAALCTRTYDPATDRRTMLGSFLLAVSYVAAVLFLAAGQKRYLILILLLFLSTFGNTELLLLSYSFLLVLCVLKQTNSDDLDEMTPINWRQLPVVVVMWLTLGLLPLVKGSLLLPFAASVVIPSGLLMYRARFRQALLLLLTPIAATLAFWVAAGQSLGDIPAFLGGTIRLTSGYTEAMSTSWSVLPGRVGDGFVMVYLVISGMIFVSVSHSSRFTASSKLVLAFLVAVFLLVAFKHGFIAVMNVSSAFASLAVYLLIISFLYMDGVLIWSLSIVMLITAATSIIRDPVLVKEVHERFGVGAAWTGGERRGDILAFCVERAIAAYSRATYIKTWSTYSGAGRGLYSRVMQRNDLEDRFAGAKANIRNHYALPKLEGTSDIYESDQSALLASDNKWNPRPIIQSYSAYTPALAILDEQHLRGRDAPDWVLFDLDLQSVDGRLPSLDDGLSWPALLDNYTFTSYDGQFVLMRRNQFIHPSSSYDDVSTKRYKTGATVMLPNADGLVFAEVDLKPTLAGRLLIALFNPPQLYIMLGLENGQTRTYRVVSNMMKTEFLLSPLVSDTGEFASLMSKSKHPDGMDRIRTLSIAPSYGGSLYWSGTYELTLKRYVENEHVLTIGGGARNSHGP